MVLNRYDGLRCTLVLHRRVLTVSLVIFVVAVVQLARESPLESRLRVAEHFKPMSEDEKKLTLELLRIIRDVCGKENITAMLYGGTLLGAVRHHGLVPWDDDVDILVNASHKARLKGALESFEECDLYSPKHGQWKLFKKSLFALSNLSQKFGWPNIDIFFFDENKTHIWDQMSWINFTQLKSDIFPLRLGMFEDFSFCIPSQAASILSSSFDVSVCQNNGPLHKRYLRYSFRIAAVPCDWLRPYFPFVERRIFEDREAVEVLKVGNTVIHTGPVPGLC